MFSSLTNAFYGDSTDLEDIEDSTTGTRSRQPEDSRKPLKTGGHSSTQTLITVKFFSENKKNGNRLRTAKNCDGPNAQSYGRAWLKRGAGILLALGLGFAGYAVLFDEGVDIDSMAVEQGDVARARSGEMTNFNERTKTETLSVRDFPPEQLNFKPFTPYTKLPSTEDDQKPSSYNSYVPLRVLTKQQAKNIELLDPETREHKFAFDEKENKLVLASTARRLGGIPYGFRQVTKLNPPLEKQFIRFVAANKHETWSAMNDLKSSENLLYFTDADSIEKKPRHHQANVLGLQRSKPIRSVRWEKDGKGQKTGNLLYTMHREEEEEDEDGKKRDLVYSTTKVIKPNSRLAVMKSSIVDLQIEAIKAKSGPEHPEVLPIDEDQSRKIRKLRKEEKVRGVLQITNAEGFAENWIFEDEASAIAVKDVILKRWEAKRRIEATLSKLAAFL